MIKKRLLVLVSLFLLLTGCSSTPETAIDGQKWQEDWIQIGLRIGMEAPEQFTLLDNKDALAADGLYYATWVTGDSRPYENSDGDVIDLYDAQLYLLASESPDEAAAQKNCSTWLAAAKENYDIASEDTITCNGQTYTMITYHCTGNDTPYDRGVSAFGTCGVSSVCAELTCLKNYEEDLTTLLTELLSGCHYSAD